MSSHHQFQKDLAFGKKAEEQVIKFFLSKGYMAFPNIGKDTRTGNKISLSAYDIRLITKKYEDRFIEVKTDRMSNRTGNIAVELSRFCGGAGWLPTGIFHSHADFIIYKIGGYFYLADRKKLVDIINKALDNESDLIERVLDGGNGKRTRIALIKRAKFVNLCECCWNEKTYEEKELRN
jgi:hypothetical protein